MRNKQHNQVSQAWLESRGFTRIELLVVIAMVVILMGLQMPGHTAEKTKSKAEQCLNNLRQLSLAWSMYAEDNSDYFLYASDDNLGTAPYQATVTALGYQYNNYAWTWSKMGFGSSPYNTDPAADIKLRPLWNYNKTVSTHKCPGDTSAVAVNGVSVPRIRSYSMNFFLGGFANDPIDDPGSYFHHYTKLSDLADAVRSPGVANTFLFIEERQDCINWGNFGTVMNGYPTPAEKVAVPAIFEWYEDLPGASHERAGGISFCDGHAEIHKWLNGTTTPTNSGAAGYITIPAPYSEDVAWMQNASVRPH